MEKVLDGDLSCFEVPDLLTFLSRELRTGVLVLERRDQETKLFLRGGKPVFATSTKEDLRLGSLLVRQGKLTPQAVEQALDAQRSNSRRLGQILVESKRLSEVELASVLKVQVSEVIFDTFSWREGSFSLWDGVAPPTTAVTLEMNLQNLLIEGVRRCDSRSRLSQVFPDLDMAVDSLANPDRLKLTVNLTPDEWKVFFLIDGRRSLSEICRLAGHAEDQTTLQILYNMHMARFVTVVPPAPAVERELDASASAAEPVDVDKTSKLPRRPPVAVAFAALAPTPKLKDDTKDIVSPKAVQYMDNVRRVTMSRLILVSEGREDSFPLTRDTYTLGRHRNNDIAISDPKVSSFHARIDRSPEGFMLVDLKSRNGTFLNGKRIESGLLKTGDELRLGTARLLYKVDYQS